MDEGPNPIRLVSHLTDQIKAGWLERKRRVMSETVAGLSFLERCRAAIFDHASQYSHPDYPVYSFINNWLPMGIPQ